MGRLRRERSGKSSWGRPADPGNVARVRLAPQSAREDAARAPLEPARERAVPANGHGNAALAAEIARVVAAEVGKGVGSLAPVVTRVGASVRDGIGRVGSALDDPSQAITTELLQQTDLPQLDGKDPLSSLAVRLDKEADLWRGIALRQIARAAWTERITIIAAALTFASEAALGGVGGFHALFASGTAATPIVLAVAALVLALGAITLAGITAVVRRSQLVLGRESLDRADCAEARLRRVAALMEIRALDPGAYVADLRELTRDEGRAD